MLNEADDLWVVNADGARATRLTTSPAADGMPVWASDGRIYFVSNRSGSKRIWSLLPQFPE
jgi:Tol biopolymer transport system component